MDELERNKQAVRAFWARAFRDGKPEDAAAEHIGRTYIQHNPLVPDGVEGFVKFVSGFLAQFPQAADEEKQLIAEGDRVVRFSHFKPSPDDRGMAAVDIFRLEDGKVVEHWDVLQPVPEESANGNTMF